MAEADTTRTPPIGTVERLIPRLYQEEIFHRAVKENVICAMDTGTGKTQIAVMLLRHIMSLQPANANPRKVAVFLVASVPLAEQQADFLQTQLELRVNKFYGAMGVDYWDRERWADAFATSDVMVMTAQVFLDLLNHAHWGIDKILLVIFDEAHHCNKNHAYAQIMRTHYHHCVPANRPRVFGMTASPIFNIRNPIMSLALLQETMDAKVLAVRDNVLELALNAPKPQEFLAEYRPPTSDYPNYPIPTMWTVLQGFDHLVFPEPDDARELQSRFSHVQTELGPLAADYFVFLFIQRTIFKNTVSSADLGAYYSRNKFVTAKTSQDAPEGRSWTDLDGAYNHHLERIQALAMGLNDALISSWFTPKLQLLIEILIANRADDFSAIIFVEQRQIATTLAWLLPMVPQLRDWVKAGALVGHGDTGGPSFEGNGMAHSTQRSIVRDFREGNTNLVIATSVAEEGLDFQACKLVVRLDAPQTMVGYLQSRGRARKHDSSYVVLTDPNGARRYRGFRDAEPQLRLVYQRMNEEEEAKQVEESLYMDEDEEDDDERYVVSSTGAVVTPASAISLLHLWCSLLVVDRFTKPPAPEFQISGDFVCTITIPASILNPSLCGPMTGPQRKTRDGARRSAAFLLVKELHRLELFDDYLMPFKKSGPNLDLSQSHDGPLRREGELFETTSPWGDIWLPDSPMWMNPVSLGDSSPLIALVTGQEQPERELTIYQRGSPNCIKIHPGRRLEFASEEERLSQMELMQRYSNCAIYWAVTSRKLPLRSACLVVPLAGTEGLLDYDRMTYVTTAYGTSQAMKLPKEDWSKPEMLGSHIMEAHRLGSNSYKLVGIRPDLSLSSAPVIPEGETKCRETDHDTYRSYWEAATHVVKRKVTLDIPEDDCWLELVSVEKTQFQQHDGLFGLVNLPGSGGPVARPRRIIIPSFMARVSPIPAEIIRICTYIPNILGQMTVLSRMDLANETLLTHGVPFELLLEALTLPAVQAGFDYQRLETIGDSVLKVSMCTHLFLKYPGHHEGQLTAIKDSVVSNANLMRIGKRSPLSRFLVTGRMHTHKTWKPPMSSTEPESSDDSDKESDEMEKKDASQKVTFHTKSLADCTESTLGATYLSLGVDAALRVGQALCLPLGGTTPWRSRPKPEIVERTEMTILFAPVEEKMGYKFNNPSLVVEAFTHTAYDLSKGPSYNRLEYLGDCLFDLYVVIYMFQKFKKMTPGQMSWARSRLVNSTTFGKLAVGLGLHKHVLTSSVGLQKAMNSFAAEIEEVSLEEILRSCWKIDAPKAISDVFEAIFGAIFVDSNFNLELTFHHIHRVMGDIMEFIAPDMPGDPTSELVRWVAGQGCEAQGSTIFRSSSSSSSKTRSGAHDTVETNLHGRTIARVTNATAKLARPMAAEITLRILQDEDHEHALSKICSCPRAVLKRKEITAMEVDA